MLYGTKLPGSAAIASTSFTINVWDGCWPIEQCDEVIAEFVTVSGASLRAQGLGASLSARGSGASPSAPTEALQAAAQVVAEALPHLTESGLPSTIALRAMAATINAIGRCRRGASLVPGWPAQQIALGFLVGALKCEWVDEESRATSPASLQASLAALQDRFGVAREHQPRVALAFDRLFCDAGLADGFETP